MEAETPKAAVPYSEEVVSIICDRLAEGESLRAICSSEGMPSTTSVKRWLREKEDFRAQYAQARESQAEHYLDEIIEIADDSSQDTEYGESGPKANNEWINRSKLRVDTRKWAMSKLAPKKYGDKLDVTSDNKALPAGPAVFQIIPASQRPAPVVDPEE